MFLVILAVLFWLIPRPVHAQDIPISYQLLMAFHPTTLNPISLSSATANIAAIAPPQVLGVSTNIPSPVPTSAATPTPIPATLPAIGGDGRTVTIAVLGDSMIDTLGPGLPALQKALAAQYPGLKLNILNYGYGASNIEQAEDRLIHDYAYNGNHFNSLLSQSPDIIVIESFAYNNFGNTENGFDRQWTALGSLTGTIKQKLPAAKIVIAATLAPNSITFGNGAPNVHFSALDKVEKTSTIKLYLENAINFANSEHYPLADAFHPSLVGTDGNSSYINTTDHIHPSPAGAQFFSQILANTIINNHLLD